MCLIIASQPDKTLAPPELDTIKDSMDMNPHGTGLVYSQGGKLHIMRYLLVDAVSVHERIKQLTDAKLPWVFHVRFATHGANNLRNCHPFQVAEHTAIAHNGVIHGYGSTRDSDTRDYLNRFARGLNMEEYHEERSLFEIFGRREIAGNKFAIISADGRVSIINKQLGADCPETGLWFSDALYIEGGAPGRWTRYSDDWSHTFEKDFQKQSDGTYKYLPDWRNKQQRTQIWFQCLACNRVFEAKEIGSECPNCQSDLQFMDPLWDAPSRQEFADKDSIDAIFKEFKAEEAMSKEIVGP